VARGLHSWLPKTTSPEESLLAQNLPIMRLSSLNLELKQLLLQQRSSLRRQPLS
jgi:hypothetical protein